MIYIGEYLSRNRLSRLGFKDDLSELDCITADALLLIDAEINSAQAEAAKKLKRS